MKWSAYIDRYGHDVRIALDAILSNRMKSLLTALGIIFGVAAVISMLAIGNGAQQEILEQMKKVGVNNIIIEPILLNPTKAASTAASTDKKEEQELDQQTRSRGLSLLDATAIQEVLPSVKAVCPIVSMNTQALYNEKSGAVVLEGTNNNYFALFNIALGKGNLFADRQVEAGMPVCIIGNHIRQLFFNEEDPMGKYMKCGEVWLKIVGIIEARDLSASGEGSISSTDDKVFIPVKTMLLRFQNHDYNQLDRLVVQVDRTEQLGASAQVIARLLNRRHNQTPDVRISIPELLLKQQQRTKNIFNVVLGAIAGISLIVGGIGIMNIMLASVLERIREIGTRQAIGASKKDIVIQFLAESTLISVAGGILGILLGILLSQIISSVFEIKTIVSVFSIVIAFGVSVLTGVLFGYLPAKRAATKDPVESLRY